MTAYDIIPLLAKPLNQHLAAFVCYDWLDRYDKIKIQPLRLTEYWEGFHVPVEDAQQIASDLNAIFESARTLTA